MSGLRTPKIAFGLVIEVASVLEAAGVPAERMPHVDDVIDAVWPVAKQLARAEKSGQLAGRSVRQAREAALASAVAKWAPAPARAEPWHWPEFRPGDWHVALVPGPEPDRAREAA
jgi:hypothetical protein